LDAPARTSAAAPKEGEQGNSSTAKGVISGSFTWTCSD
jgi:hypothetical protein